MKYLGTYTELEIDRFRSVGAYLTDEDDFEVLLPNKYLEDNMDLGDMIRVFIYNDSEDRPVATTETPKITLNQLGCLTVKAVSSFGAFLDWGLEKDLLVPFKEQTIKMKEGQSYIVKLILDEKTNRLIASAKLGKYLSTQQLTLKQGDQVDLLIAEATDLGRKVIVDNAYFGLIYHNHIIKPLTMGMRTKGYIDLVRDDGKLDISLAPTGVEKFDEFTDKLMQHLQENNGTISLTDKSSPEEIRQILGMSKKSFKKAVGNLYKQRKIKLSETHITLLN